MNEGDLYELAEILGHAKIKMTDRYAKLGRQHIARTGNTAREIWKLLEQEDGDKIVYRLNVRDLYVERKLKLCGRR